MKKKTVAMINELIGATFGWAWLIGIPIWIYFLVQWIRGVHPWWYFAIAIAVAGLCKSLCREYKKQSEDMFYESTGRDYASEWIDLPDEGKKKAIVEAFRAIVSKYHPDDIESWITQYEKTNRFDDFISEITKRYRETGLRKPYQVVCHIFIDNYFLSIAGIKR